MTTIRSLKYYPPPVKQIAVKRIMIIVALYHKMSTKDISFICLTKTFQHNVIIINLEQKHSVVKRNFPLLLQSMADNKAMPTLMLV